VDIAVHHMAAPDRANSIARSLTDRLGERLRALYVTEIGAAVAAHAGPGLACVVVHRLST
jgi:fatty acid-binding protein DegV